MLYYHRVDILLILVMFLFEHGDFCDTQIKETCEEFFGDLVIRYENQKDWSNLRRLYGRLVIKAPNVSIVLPNLEEIIGQPPLIIVKNNLSGFEVPQLRLLQSLTALAYNLTDGEILIQFAGWPNIQPATMIYLQKLSKGALRVQGLTLVEFVKKHDPILPWSIYIEPIFILLSITWLVPLAYLILKVRYYVEIKVLDWKVKDDLKLMKEHLLERRKQKLSRLKLYHQHIYGGLNLFKILGIKNPKKMRASYKHDPLRMEAYEEWLEKQLGAYEFHRKLAEFVPAEIPRTIYPVDKDFEDAQNLKAEFRRRKSRWAIRKCNKLIKTIPKRNSGLDAKWTKYEDELKSSLNEEKPVAELNAPISLPGIYQLAKSTSNNEIRTIDDENPWEENLYDDEVAEELKAKS